MILSIGPSGLFHICSVRKKCIHSWFTFSSSSLLEDNTDEQGKVIPRSTVLRTLNAGQLIYSLAFGSKTSSGTGGRVSSWFRFKVPDDLILAAGLRNGRIRTWIVRTGELHVHNQCTDSIYSMYMIQVYVE